MSAISEIPIFNYIQKNDCLPIVNFGELNRKHKIKYPFLYKILSTQICKNVFSAKNYFIELSSFSFIQDYLNSNHCEFEEFHTFKDTSLFTLTIPALKADSLITNIIIVTTINNKIVLDILSFSNIDLLTWLSGVLYDKNQMHITVSYNLNETKSLEVLNLFHFVSRLMSLKKYDRLLVSNTTNQINSEKIVDTEKYLTHIDISNIREYLIPSTKRREHYRWQYCGPGRTILRHIKVQSSVVKNHIRKGKRLT